MFECLQPPLGEPLGLAFLLRDEAHHGLVQSGGQGVGFDIGHEAGAVL